MAEFKNSIELDAEKISVYARGLKSYRKKEYKKAYELFSMATDTYPEAFPILFYMQLRGLGTPIKTLGELDSAWRSNAENNIRKIDATSSALNPIVKHAMGFCFEQGFGVVSDAKQAFALYQETAKPEVSKYQNPYACFDLARCYNVPSGPGGNLWEAMRYFRLAYKGGCLEAAYDLAECYYRRPAVKDDKEAFHWYQRAVEGGSTKALVFLADCYYHGIGTDRNDREARKYYLQIQNKTPEVNRRLADYYYTGVVKHSASSSSSASSSVSSSASSSASSSQSAMPVRDGKLLVSNVLPLMLTANISGAVNPTAAGSSVADSIAVGLPDPVVREGDKQPTLDSH